MHPGKELIIEKGVYESHHDMLDKLDEMNDQLEETDNMENTDMENQEPIDEKLVGKQKNIDKNDNGKIDAEDFKILNKSNFFLQNLVVQYQILCLICNNKEMISFL